AGLVKRSETYVAQQFGSDVKWVAINSAAWSAIAAHKDHALTLTGVDAVAKIASAEPNDVLAVLALLSRPETGLLKMEYLGNRGDNASQVSKEEVVNRLRAWWKDKTLSDDEWHSWAGNIVVKWRAAEVSR